LVEGTLAHGTRMAGNQAGINCPFSPVLQIGVGGCLGGG
jgi:hypothetical protein